MEDAILHRKLCIPSINASYSIAEYIYDKPALSVHADGFLEYVLDCFSVDVVATHHRPAPGMDVVEADPEDAVLIYNIADVLIVRPCPRFYQVIKFFRGHHNIYWS